MNAKKYATWRKKNKQTVLLKVTHKDTMGGHESTMFGLDLSPEDKRTKGAPTNSPGKMMLQAKIFQYEEIEMKKIVSIEIVDSGAVAETLNKLLEINRCVL